jgi:hypothetical protein
MTIAGTSLSPASFAKVLDNIIFFPSPFQKVDKV